MLDQKELLIYFAKKVDLSLLEKICYHKPDGTIKMAIDEFIEVLNQCQEGKNDS